MTDIDRLSAEVVDAAVRIHRKLGPGLLESVYETLLAASIDRAGWKVARQMPVGISFEGMHFPCAFRADIVVEDRLVVEVKSVDQFTKVHGKQLLTYLRLLNQPVGLLLNFGGETMKGGIRRIVNGYTPAEGRSASPRLRVKMDYGD
jgi:iron complex transport system substrate-binding protein